MNETTSRNRVSKNTSDESNEMIRKRTRSSIESYLYRPPGEIEKRLKELDEEWDIERAIEANASSLALAGIGLAFLVGNKKWLVMPAMVAGFLLQHALQGWCPPVPVLRKLGFRTPGEIEEERYALKLMKGDFDRVTGRSRKDMKVDEIYGTVAH